MGYGENVLAGTPVTQVAAAGVDLCAAAWSCSMMPGKAIAAAEKSARSNVGGLVMMLMVRIAGRSQVQFVVLKTLRVCLF